MRTATISALLCLVTTATAIPLASCDSDLMLADSATWEGKLIMELWIADDNVEAGRHLGIRAEVENSSGEPADYTVWNTGDPPIYIQVIPPSGEAIPLMSGTPHQTVLPDVTVGQLEAGRKMVRKVKWDVPADAINGTYELQARFYPGDQSALPEVEPMLVRQEIEVFDGADVLGRDELEDKVQELESVRLWLRAHTGTAVARQNKGAYTVNMQGEWESADEQTYNHALEAALPAQWRLTDTSPRQWKVSYDSNFGFPPSEIVVLLDAQSGEVISTTPDLASELKGGVIATFEVQQSTFRLFSTDPDTISDLYKLLDNQSQAGIPNGPLLPGPGPGLHNAPWSWHLDPAATTMAEFTIEVCDGTPEFVEKELSYWLESVGQYCPWNARLADIEDYR